MSNSFYIYETQFELKGDVGMTEAELLQKMTVKSSRGDRDYHPEEIARAVEIIERMKKSLSSIAWTIDATAPQSMSMKNEARKGLYPK